MADLPCERDVGMPGTQANLEQDLSRSAAPNTHAITENSDYKSQLQFLHRYTKHSWMGASTCQGRTSVTCLAPQDAPERSLQCTM